MDLLDPLQMVRVKMDQQLDDRVEVKREVEDDGEDEPDCYPGEEEEEVEVDTDHFTILSEDVLLRRNHCQATGPEPGIDQWEGPAQLRFQFEDIGKWKKRGYTYSEKLNKLYIEMGKPVGVRFSLDQSSVVDLSGTVIRALPVYLETLHRGKPVSRCPVHSSPEDPSNAHTDPAILKHLVRTSEPGTLYEENPRSGRLSTVVRTKEANPGCDYFTVSYQFMCLGSCMGGIGRRPICLVFTLESNSGEVLGRQVVELRICTCPLRDMQQDEQKKTKGDCTPVKISSSLSLPAMSLAQSDSSSVSSSTTVRSGGDTDDLYFVPVRGFNNFQLVNRVAESLELSQADLLSETAERLKTERNKILRAKNPLLSLSEPEQGPPGKMRKLEVTSSGPAQQTRYLLPLMPKAKTVLAGQSLLLPRSNTNTIVLPPRPPLGRGASHHLNIQTKIKQEHPGVKQEHTTRVKQEKDEVDEEEDEEGVDQPDSLYCSETIEEVDGLMEFRRKIESDV